MSTQKKDKDIYLTDSGEGQRISFDSKVEKEKTEYFKEEDDPIRVFVPVYDIKNVRIFKDKDGVK